MENTTFDMPIDEFRKFGHELVEWIANYFEKIEENPVLPPIKPGEIKNQLPQNPPLKGEDFSNIVDDLKKIIMPGVTHWNHPNFMAYFNSTSTGPGILGEFLSAALNSNGMIWKTAPASTELEEVVLIWFRKMLQLPERFFGIVYDLASMSSMHAIAAARENAKKIYNHFDISKLRIYCSEQAHSSIEKGAKTLGIPLSGVIKIKTDREFRLIPSELEESIQNDIRNGLQPFCVVATAGTTSTTSIDPIDKMVFIARNYNLWLHIDAAHAGSAAILPEVRSILSGVEDADSIVINPHKWLFIPIDFSVLYTSKPEIIKKAFSIVPEYLKTDEESKVINYMDYGIQLGRRFRSLKFWFTLRYFGVEGLQKIIREHLRLGELFADFIDKHPHFERLAPTPLSTICFRAVPNLKMSEEELNEFNKELLDEINNSGKLFLSHTKLNDKFTIRLTISGIRTSEQHVVAAWELIKSKFEFMMP